MDGTVLVVDKSGQPRDWTSIIDNKNSACKYYAEDMVICDLGSPIVTLRGGKNKNGVQSLITVNSIIMVKGPVMGETFHTRETKYAERKILYARDAFLCAYCGVTFKEDLLTIDHVIPRAHGGPHTWTNTVTACKACNHWKADRTPEKAGMQLLYVPFAPNLQEKLLLKKRRVLADQMEYLLSVIPKTSRVHKNPLYQLN